MVEKVLKMFKEKKQKVGDNTLSQIHHNGILQKGNAITIKVQTLHSWVFLLGYQLLWLNYFIKMWRGGKVFVDFHNGSFIANEAREDPLNK